MTVKICQLGTSWLRCGCQEARQRSRVGLGSCGLSVSGVAQSLWTSQDLGLGRAGLLCALESPVVKKKTASSTRNGESLEKSWEYFCIWGGPTVQLQQPPRCWWALEGPSMRAPTKPSSPISSLGRRVQVPSIPKTAGRFSVDGWNVNVDHWELYGHCMGTSWYLSSNGCVS